MVWVRFFDLAWQGGPHLLPSKSDLESNDPREKQDPTIPENPLGTLKTAFSEDMQKFDPPASSKP
ncbi:MAG: hypothetical protein MK312_06565, partial [Roseibacillus sp.]|nr:hypothetical protein [Roseibacillus sp.]